MNVICEVLLVYRYLSRHSFSDGGSPDRRKNEFTPSVLAAPLCGEPWSPFTSLWLAGAAKGLPAYGRRVNLVLTENTNEIRESREQFHPSWTAMVPFITWVNRKGRLVGASFLMVPIFVLPSSTKNRRVFRSATWPRRIEKFLFVY
jgi:hypothetical protein